MACWNGSCYQVPPLGETAPTTKKATRDGSHSSLATTFSRSIFNSVFVARPCKRSASTGPLKFDWAKPHKIWLQQGCAQHQGMFSVTALAATPLLEHGPAWSKPLQWVKQHVGLSENMAYRNIFILITETAHMINKSSNFGVPYFQTHPCQ